jgi:predicted metalloprotease
MPNGRQTLQKSDLPYTSVNWVIFWGQTVESPACGLMKPRDGAAYCGYSDQTVYYPLEDEAHKFGDFAVATTTAHELGHHVQDQLGLFDQKNTGKYTSRQIELGADCLSGVWAYSVYTRNLLQKGDIEEAMSWKFVGDLPGTSPADPTAHGSPTERVEAFLAGFNSGDPSRCFDYTPTPEETTE